MLHSSKSSYILYSDTSYKILLSSRQHREIYIFFQEKHLEAEKVQSKTRLENLFVEILW